MPTPSYIQIYTGNGKGKTTAALGLAMRALGWGWKVGIIYFDKGGNDYGERRVLDFLHKMYAGKAGGDPSFNSSPLRGEGQPAHRSLSVGGVDYEVTGLDRRDKATSRFRFGVLEEDKVEGARGLKIAADWVTSGKYQLVILDEINTTASLGIISVDQVLAILKQKHPETEVVLTGRNCPPEFLALADLITEMKPIKHYFESKTQAARQGIEF